MRQTGTNVSVFSGMTSKNRILSAISELYLKIIVTSDVFFMICRINNESMLVENESCYNAMCTMRLQPPKVAFLCR